MSGRKLAGIAAACIALGWMIALAGEVFSQRSERTIEWLRQRDLKADRDEATTLDRLKSWSWPGYTLSAVLAGYTALVVLGIPNAGVRAGRLRISAAVLSTVGLTVAGWRLAGDFSWSLWEIAIGDTISLIGYILALSLVSAPPHTVHHETRGA